jgi:hypothetical protein
MKRYRDSLKQAANQAGTSIQFAGSDMGEWTYPVPYRVDDWQAAEKVIEQLEDQGWFLDERQDGYVALSIDDHVVEVTRGQEETRFVLDTRKAITSAPAH